MQYLGDKKASGGTNPAPRKTSNKYKFGVVVVVIALIAVAASRGYFGF